MKEKHTRRNEHRNKKNRLFISRLTIFLSFHNFILFFFGLEFHLLKINRRKCAEGN